MAQKFVDVGLAGLPGDASPELEIVIREAVVGRNIGEGGADEAFGRSDQADLHSINITTEEGDSRS